MAIITIKAALTTVKIHTNDNKVMFTVTKVEGI